MSDPERQEDSPDDEGSSVPDEEGPGAEGGASEGGAGDEAEIGEALSELERVESKRRTFGVAIGIGAVVVVVGAILFAAEYRSFLFQPKMPIEKNERKIVRKTDDPQCRQLIADVTEIGNRYYVLESEIEKTIPGDDPEAIRKLDRKLVTLQERLDRAEELSREANLRYENSRKELDKWFSYTTYEIDILRDVIDNQLAELEPQRPERGADADAGAPDGGNLGAGDARAAEGDAERADTGSGSTVSAGGNDRTPTERRDGAMVELHDAFENFRVWHEGDTHKHPCGDNEEGETPWRPDDWEEKVDAGGGAGAR